MADAAWLRKVLAEQYGITTEEELNAAISSMEAPDIGACISKPKQNAKRKEILACAS